MEKRPPRPARAKIAGTPANWWRGLNADEKSVTVSPRAQPPATEPKTRTTSPAGTEDGETCSDAAAALAGVIADNARAMAIARFTKISPGLPRPGGVETRKR